MITSYCKPCIYCRSAGIVTACHYYLDMHKKLPCPTGDGCTERTILPPDQRAAYIASKSEIRAYRTQRDWHLDDYIHDGRGIVGEDYNIVDYGR